MIKSEIKDFNAMLTFSLIIVAFIIGQVFDSLRDGVVESILDHDLTLRIWKQKKVRVLSKVKWDFFSTAAETEIDKLDDNYYIWYGIDVNLFLSFLAVAGIIVYKIAFQNYIVNNPHQQRIIAVLVLIVASSIIFLIDFLVLRIEISDITNKGSEKNSEIK